MFSQWGVLPEPAVRVSCRRAGRLREVRHAHHRYQLRIVRQRMSKRCALHGTDPACSAYLQAAAVNHRQTGESRQSPFEGPFASRRVSVDGLGPATLVAGDVKDPSRVLFLIDARDQPCVAVDEDPIALCESGQSAERADDRGDSALSGLRGDVIERSARLDDQRPASGPVGLGRWGARTRQNRRTRTPSQTPAYSSFPQPRAGSAEPHSCDRKQPKHAPHPSSLHDSTRHTSGSAGVKGARQDQPVGPINALGSAVMRRGHALIMTTAAIIRASSGNTPIRWARRSVVVRAQTPSVLETPPRPPLNRTGAIGKLL